jgi:hypothetical protein
MNKAKNIARMPAQKPKPKPVNSLRSKKPHLAEGAKISAPREANRASTRARTRFDPTG